jgi:transposase
MRGDGQHQEAMFSYLTMEQRIPADHPIRAIRTMVDEAPRQMDAKFSRMYAQRGRPSIAPERLLRAQLLVVLYSIASERLTHALKQKKPLSSLNVAVVPVRHSVESGFARPRM